MPSSWLKKPDDVAVWVLHGSDQHAPTDILYLLLHFCSSVEECLQALLDVVNMPVGERPGHPLAVAVRVQTEILAVDFEADVVGLVRVGLHARELAV